MHHTLYIYILQTFITDYMQLYRRVAAAQTNVRMAKLTLSQWERVAALLVTEIASWSADAGP